MRRECRRLTTQETIEDGGTERCPEAEKHLFSKGGSRGQVVTPFPGGNNLPATSALTKRDRFSFRTFFHYSTFILAVYIVHPVVKLALLLYCIVVV